jgi:hypothetical protein
MQHPRFSSFQFRFSNIKFPISIFELPCSSFQFRFSIFQFRFSSPSYLLEMKVHPIMSCRINEGLDRLACFRTPSNHPLIPSLDKEGT